MTSDAADRLDTIPLLSQGAGAGKARVMEAARVSAREAMNFIFRKLGLKRSRGEAEEVLEEVCVEMR